MTPRGSTIGIDNWPKRWAQKAEALKRVDWVRFRQDSVLMEGIETKPLQLRLWLERARAMGVEPQHMADAMVGDPKGEQLDGFFMTANSVRMACYVHRILKHWKPPQRYDALEIGGGYGALLLALWVTRPPEKYYAIDSAPMVRLQEEYARRTTRVEVSAFPGADVHLVVNTNSFGEMDLGEVLRYFAIIEKHLVDGGAFYTQNRVERVTDFRRYPYGPGWRHVLVKNPFGDKAWVECLSIRDRGASSPHPLEMLAR